MCVCVTFAYQMTSTSIIIPCLYNSYSFMRENINDSMIYYDTFSFRPIHIPVKYEAQPITTAVEEQREEEPVPVFVPMVSDYTTKKSDSSSSDESSCSSDAESETSTSSSSSSCKPTSTNIDFHPDMMKSYIVSHLNPATSTDSLIWIAYIIIYGIEKLETIENHYTTSNTFKFELIEMMRKSKTILKANKLKLTGIEETLVHKPFINLETLHAIIVCKGLSLCIVQDRKYYEIQGGTGANGDDSFIIEKIKGKYVLYMAPKEIKIAYLNYIRTNYWLMESISAPIRPISAYKLQDLIDISVKLNLPVATITPGKFGSMGTEKRKTKPELYEAICKCV